ncbi:MAG: hypothetical protein ABH833_01015, partial [Parcubacteria group bacterium]
MSKEDKLKKKFISLTEASERSPYSQEYLSLLARKGKLPAKKIGRNWFTTKDGLDWYLQKQGLKIILPKSEFSPSHQGKIKKPIIMDRNTVMAAVASLSPQVEEEISVPDNDLSPKVETALGSIAETLSSLSDIQKEQVERQTKTESILSNRHQNNEDEFFEIERKSVLHRYHKFNYIANSFLSSPRKLLAIIIISFILLFILGGGLSFGNINKLQNRVSSFFKDADTLQGHFAGTHSNEVLLLDKGGNISIFGHIETQGQLRSYAPDGVAPIVIDSSTLIENLNAEYLNGLKGQDFTLAFVTKNGNITYEDVFLEGDVEVGKTLIVKGATELMDELNVYGELGVFEDAIFSENIQLTSGDLLIDEGTIKINNTEMIENLNTEFFQGYVPENFNLDFVVENGNSTDDLALFYGGVYGSDGIFGTLGVAGDASIGDLNNPNDSNFQLSSKQLRVDMDGNITVRQSLSTNDLVVGNVVDSHLIPSATMTYDLGTVDKRWRTIFGGTASITNLDVTNITVSNSITHLDIVTASISTGLELSYLTSGSVVFVAASGSLTEDNDNFYWDDANNRLGIGTSLPSVTLDVIGSASISGNFEIIGYASASETYGSGLADCDNGTTSKLLYNSTTGMFSCGTDSGIGSISGIEIKEGGTQIQAVASSLSFEPAHFSLTASGSSDVAIRLDWGAGGPASLSEDETVAGLWSFAGGASITGGTFEVIGTASVSSLNVAGNIDTSFTQGSVVFAGASGVLTEDNTSFFWDDSSDRLGIGTVSPGAKLHIKSSDVYPAIIEGSNATWAGFQQKATTSGAKPYVELFNSADGKYWGILMDPTADIFQIWNTGSVTPRMTINNSGNVGIGTTVPGYKLSVAGTASVSGGFYGSGLVDCDTGITSKLLYDASTGKFSCGTDTDTGSDYGGIDVMEGAVATVTGTSSLSFESGHFTVTDNAGIAEVRLDWGAGGPASLSEDETVAGDWIFSNNASVTNTFEAGAIKTDTLSASTGTLTINAFTLGGAVTGNTQNITGLGQLTVDNLRLDGNTLDTTSGNLTLDSNGGTTAIDDILTVSGQATFSSNVSISGDLETAGSASASETYGSGLTNCTGATTSKLLYDASTGKFSCGTDTDTGSD